MSQPSVKLVSSTQDSEALALLLEALPSALTQLVGDQIITASYGYGCYLHPDLWYIPMKVGTGWLGRFIQESRDQGIYVPGRSDIYFEFSEKRMEIEFCHEGNIHLSGIDAQLRTDFLQLAPFNGLSFTVVEPGPNNSFKPKPLRGSA